MSTLILCFHRVANPDHGGRSALAISPKDFERVLDQVGSRYEFVSLEQGMTPSRTKRAVVTFDDGYADNLHTAMPILERRGIPVTFFITTGFIDSDHLFPADAMDGVYDAIHDGVDLPGELGQLTGMTYWEALDKLSGSSDPVFWAMIASLSALARQRVLDTDSHRRPMTLLELRKLADRPGVTLGPHTHTHRRLTSVSVSEALTDVSRGIDWLEDKGLGLVPYFAYPFGQSSDVSPEVTTRVRGLGYEPLTTLPTLVTPRTQKVFSSVGVPRLSVGPLEVPVIALLSRVLPLVSSFPRAWLSALALRRALLAG